MAVKQSVVADANTLTHDLCGLIIIENELLFNINMKIKVVVSENMNRATPTLLL